MAKHPRNLAGKVIAITGGARGIGRTTAQECLHAGMKIALGDVDPQAAEQTAAEMGANVIALPLDVTEHASFRAFLDAVDELLGPLDVLINNAGIMPLGPFVDESDATAKRIIDINVHGVIHGMKCALPGMMARRQGHIVNIASQAGKYGFPGGATYCASKAAVINLSRAVRKELRGQGIDISVISPVAVNTELGLGLAEPRQRRFRKIEPHQVAAAIMQTLREPTFDVHVPRDLKISERLNSLLPISAQDSVSRVLKADAVLSHIDAGARADYELRAAHSEPSLDAAPDQARITERTGSS
jgi:NADP-dependent 3-hydroxy acid dehydrogenase YdfG